MLTQFRYITATGFHTFAIKGVAMSVTSLEVQLGCGMLLTEFTLPSSYYNTKGPITFLAVSQN